MKKIKQVQIIRIISFATLIASLITAGLSPEPGHSNLAVACILIPFVCLSGVGAYIYFSLSKEEKRKIRGPGTFGIWPTVVTHPYFLFGAIITMDIFFIIGFTVF